MVGNEEGETNKADFLRCALRVYRFLGLFCGELEVNGPIRGKCG